MMTMNSNIHNLPETQKIKVSILNPVMYTNMNYKISTYRPTVDQIIYEQSFLI
jgi:hypothetical protein